GNPKGAIRHFQLALKHAPSRSGYIRVNYGHALVSEGSKKRVDEAIRQIRKGLAADPTAIAGYQYLAMAYSFQNRPSDALLASAEFEMRRGKKREAKQYARRAQKAFKRGSPKWLRAEDIILAK
ncbi:MAG: M48 family peptidase, partial [Pseudomonadota bacterium]